MSAKRELVPLRDLLKPVRDAVAVEDDQTYEQVTVTIRGRGLRRRAILKGAKIKTKRQFRVTSGQLLVSKIDARNGGISVVPAELNGAIVSGDFPVFDVDTERCLPAYLDLYVKRPAFWEECLLVSEGSTNRVRLVPEQFLDLEIELPAVAQQRRIAHLVDQIDQASHSANRTAHERERLFGALAADIFDTAAAEERRLGELTRLASGGTPSRDDPANYGGDIPWVKTGEVRFNRLVDTEEHITKRGLESSAAKLLPVGTVLLAMYGQGATRGRCALLDAEMATNQACAAILPCDELIPEFVFYFLWSRYETIRLESEGSAQDNLNQGQIADIELPVPTLEAQRDIVGKLGVVRSAADCASREAAAYWPFRATLVEDLVTGVRPVPDPPR